MGEHTGNMFGFLLGVSETNPSIRLNGGRLLGKVCHLSKLAVSRGYMGVSINGGTQNGWFIVENPMRMDDESGYPYFRKP